MNKILLFLFLSPLCFSQKWSISFSERSALVQLFTATHGENWSTKWDLDKDPRYWYGIKIKKGSVSEINLRGNALKGNFPSSLSSLTKLEKLDLSSNQLEGEVSSTVSSLGELTRLDISNNRLTGDPTSAIVPLSKLQEISLGNNQFVFSDIEGFVQNFPNVIILDLANIGLTAVPQ
ncbi:leucine-rich repeat domain-containing protein, partial [Kaistella carnis]